LRSKSFLFFRITKLAEAEVEQDEALSRQEALKDVGRRRSPLVLFLPSLASTGLVPLPQLLGD